jgi:hypothetical protein
VTIFGSVLSKRNFPPYVSIWLLVSTILSPKGALMFTFEAKIRVAGRISIVHVTARDSAQARSLVNAQYGPNVTILQVIRR